MRPGLAFASLFIFGTATNAQLSTRQLHVREEIRIDGNEEDFLFPFGFLHVNPRRNEIMFANWTTFQVKYYDANGKNVRNFGGKGAGPGEFLAVNWRGGQRANFDGGLIGDSLWTYDWDSRRLTFISDKGKLLRSVMAPHLPAPSPAQMWLGFVGASPVGVLADGSILARTTTPSSPSGERGRESYVLIAPDAKSFRVVATTPERKGKTISVMDPRIGKPRSHGIPFTPGARIATAPDGNRLVVISAEYTNGTQGKLTLNIISARGDTIATRAYAIEGRPLRKAEIDQYFNALHADLNAKGHDGRPAFDPKYSTELLAKLRAALPANRLTIGQARIGIDNSIWLYLPHNDTESAWYVFDERGEPYGFVIHKRKNGLMLQTASKHAMWIMEYDEDGFPQIVRYALTFAGGRRCASVQPCGG